MALLHVDFFSEVLGMSTQMDVILPQQAHAQIGMGSNSEQGKWKVLYLLHGLSDDHTIWQRRTGIERYVAEKPLAVIMPETQRGWYTDMKYGFDWFTYFTRELPKIVSAFFPNVSEAREDTFVAGLSMGGYGALKMAMTCPERYGKAASLSGAVDIAEFFENVGSDEKREFEDIFGDLSSVRGSEHDLFALTNRLKASGRPQPELYLCCGTEDRLYWQSVRLRNLMRSLDMNVRYEEASGNHTWEFWDTHIRDVLNWMLPSKEV